MGFEAWRHFWRARLYAALGRRDAAEEAYRAVLRHAPDHVPSLKALAYLLSARQAYAQAEPLWLAAIARAPDAASWYDLGSLRERQGRYEEAIEAFRAAVILDPDFDRAWYGMGLNYATSGRHAEAAQSFEQAARRVPRNPHVAYALGMAWHRAGAPDKVAGVARHLVSTHPPTARQLIEDSGRNDLAHLIADLRR